MKDKVMVGPGKLPTGNQAALRAFALAYPGSHEDFPWGERVVKVKGKVFVFLGRDEAGLGLTVKLPQSGLMALGLPFVSPAGYGMGKSGWVTVQFAPRGKPPMDLMRAWIDESYRAVAPKKLAATLSAAEPSPAGRTKTKEATKAAAPRKRKAR